MEIYKFGVNLAKCFSCVIWNPFSTSFREFYLLEILSSRFVLVVHAPMGLWKELTLQEK